MPSSAALPASPLATSAIVPSPPAATTKPTPRVRGRARQFRGMAGVAGFRHDRPQALQAERVQGARQAPPPSPAGGWIEHDEHARRGPPPAGDGTVTVARQP